MSESTAKRTRTCSTEKDLTALARGSKRICLPIDRAEYVRIVMEPPAFRQWLDPLIAQYPELFPAAITQGYRLHDILPVSKKLPDVRLRRITVADPQLPAGNAFTIAPASVLPYMTGYTDAVAHALFLRGKFGVPYWALTRVFGHNDLYWERLELNLGHNNIVGTTVKHAAHLPQDVLADEKHTWLNGTPVDVATTVADDCILGASVAIHADEADLTVAYQQFKTEAQTVNADYQPTTVNTDGWQATQLAWRKLFTHVTLIVCFLHAFLKIRDRGKHMQEHFRELCHQVWHCYHATTAPKFLERCAALKIWATTTLPAGKGLEAVLKLCARAPQFVQAYDHPTAHRTSNMLDRRMDHMDRRFYTAHYFHGQLMTAEYAVRAEALLVNFLPYCPRAAVAKQYRSPAHKLNGFVYHDDWLHNLLISASLGGLSAVTTESVRSSGTQQIEPGDFMSVKATQQRGFVDAADFGFSPEASGIENARALQCAVDRGGTIIVSRPGIYRMADTVFLGSHTSLVFGNDVFLKKVDEQGPFTHVLLNKGALTRTFDENITVDGLHIIVNGIDVRKFLAYGLHGQLAFFYVKDLRIERFRCMDLGRAQYAIHVCTFEDVLINDVIIKGDKDGVHLGRGKRFTISNGVFQTFDDAVALNGQDYDVGNPEMGWIEDGVVEKCYDLNAEKTTGFFCRIVAGGWIDWRPGMAVQKSDTVVSNGRLYRVQADPDGTIYTSTTQPTHEHGSQVLDGIAWGAGQTDVTYTAGVRNVVFRDIFLYKPRIGFSVHFSKDKYDRSYYPGAEIPVQEQLTFDNVRVLHDQPTPLFEINTPMDVITLTNSSLRNNRIEFRSNDALPDYLKTRINMVGCVFNQKGTMELVTNSVAGKEIALKTSASTELHDDFTAKVVPGKGRITVASDLTGLRS